MCCCGDEHNEDPLYKASRSAACCTLTIEIIVVVLGIVLGILLTGVAILVCAFAVISSYSGDSSSSSTLSYSSTVYKSSNDLRCEELGAAGTYENPRHYLDCNSGAAKSTSGQVHCNDHTSSSSYNNNKPTGCVCDKSSATHELYFNIGNNTMPASNTDVLICASYSQRRALRSANKDLSTTEKLAGAHEVSWTNRISELIVPEAIQKLQKKENLDKFMLENFGIRQNIGGRHLTEDACAKDTKFCKPFREASIAGCKAGKTIVDTNWLNYIVAICGIVFYSMIACNCCQGCCGGYQQKNKIVMVYSAVVSIWALVQVILLASLAGALGTIKTLCRDNKVEPGLVQALETIELIIVGVTVFQGIVLLCRVISAYYMFKAQKVPHNGDAKANGGTAAAVVPAGQVVVVQAAEAK